MRNKLFTNALLGFGISFNALADAPSVAVDIAPLHSLVSQVMEGVDQPNLLIPAEASPHAYSLRPSQARALSEAQVVFWMGEQFTPWLDKAMDNVASSAHKVSALELKGTTTYEFREGTTFEKHAHHEEKGHHDEHKDEHAHHEEHKDSHGHHDDHHDEHDDEHHDHGPGLLDRFFSLFSSHDHEHEEDHHDEHEHHDGHEEDAHHEHGHEGIDPHAWLDPENAKVWILEIQNVLAKHDATNAQVYEQNAAKAIASLDQLIEQTRSDIENLGELNFIVFHDAYQYFEKRFGISAAGSISLGDAEDPSPARIEEIRNTVKELGVNCVFAEPQFDSGLVENVFEGSTITAIGVMDPLGAKVEMGNNHYPDLIKGMVSSLSLCNK